MQADRQTDILIKILCIPTGDKVKITKSRVWGKVTGRLLDGAKPSRDTIYVSHLFRYY